jgi:diguanylate cyclase (GGDEF)-like protein
MTADEVLQSVEKNLLSRRLDAIERFVFQQSWLGRTYEEMAQECAYGSDYVKEIGSQLWQDLSKAAGERVTKKNLHIVFSQIQANAANTSPQKQPIPSSGVPQPSTTNGSFAIPIEPQPDENKLEFPSGPVPLGSRFYISRSPIEEIVCAEIHQPGCVVRIKAPRKMGKTSLLHRLMEYAQAHEFRTVYLNFQEAETSIFASLEKFLRWFCANVSKQLNLQPRISDYWDEDIGSKVSCKTYFEDYLLEQIHTPVLLILDEVNRIFEYPVIAQDFLPMLRSWHEQAQQSEIWQKLRLTVAHATEIYIPLKLNQSPFNVGLLVTLPQFTLEQVQDLAQRYELTWQNEAGTQKTAALQALVGGHPYLVRVAFYHLAQAQMSLDELLGFAPTQAGIYSSHLRSLLVMLQEQPALVSALRQVVSTDDSVHLDAIAAHKLESMGLVHLNGNQAMPSCELYRLFFREELAEPNWADASLILPKQNQLSFRSADQLDPLTQFVTRDCFNQYLEAEVQNWVNARAKVSLILCSIDYFKYFNEAYGVQIGDACLREIAITIQDCVDPYPSAMLARYSGAKFAILLPETEAQVAAEIAETIRAKIKAQAFSHDQSKFGGFPASVLTASFGVASLSATESIASALITVAEEALKQSQRRGHDCTTLSQTIDVHQPDYYFLSAG